MPAVLSPYKIAQIVELDRAGKEYAYIARVLDVSEESVGKYAGQARIDAYIKLAPAGDLCSTEIDGLRVLLDLLPQLTAGTLLSTTDFRAFRRLLAYLGQLGDVKLLTAKEIQQHRTFFGPGGVDLGALALIQASFTAFTCTRCQHTFAYLAAMIDIKCPSCCTTFRARTAPE